MSKTFTLNEAQVLLPVLESLMERARSSAARAGELELEMEMLRQRIFVSGGMHVDVVTAARRRAEQEKSVGETKATVAEIEQIGAEMHDLGEGLLDLPCQTEHGAMMLCWKMGERAVAFWHPPGETGERLPIEGGFGRGERERLN